MKPHPVSEDSPEKSVPSPSGPGKSNIFVKTLKVLGWTLFGLIALVAIVLAVGLSYLKPERLTPLIEDQASSMMNADVELDRAELSFFSTFPRLQVELRGLRVATHAFDSLASAVRESLPAYADSLAGLDSISAGINLASLLKGEIALTDIYIEKPYLNYVQATPHTGSLDIFPPADEPEKPSEGGVPDISFGLFEIAGGFPVRYFSLPDSIDAALNVGTLRADGNGRPDYSIDLSGHAGARAGELSVPRLSVGTGGKIVWSHTAPADIALEQFRIGVGEVNFRLSTDLSLSDPSMLRTFVLNLDSTPVSEIIAVVPPQFLDGVLDGFSPGFDLSAELELKEPYRLGTDILPTFGLKLDVPQGGTLTYDGMKVSDMALAFRADVDGHDLNASEAYIDRLYMRGEGMGFELKGTVRHPLSDLRLDGEFRGGLSVEHLPRRLLSMIPGKLKGLLKANCDFGFSLSDLSRERFHRIRLSGDATLTGLDIDMPELPIVLKSRRIGLDFGTNSTIKRAAGGRSAGRADSLLTAKLVIDTLSCRMPGMEIACSGVKAGVGCRNVASSADTTLINPIGASVRADYLQYRSTEDSVRVRLRKASVGGALTRFKGNLREPRLTLTIKAERAFYADAKNRAFLADAMSGVTVHPSTSPFAVRSRQRIDSLRRLYPGLPADSLLAMSRKGRRPRAHRAESDMQQPEALDIRVDGTMRRMLRQWGAEGRLRAARAFAFTPYFPLRTRISGLDMRFNSDSVEISDTHIRAGHSDFRIRGTISNITRALTSRTGRQTLNMRFNLESDTINVNEIAAATFAGAAFAETHPGEPISVGLPDDAADDMAAVDAAAFTATTDTMAVLVIPANIDARIDVHAANIIYSDLAFRDFTGTLNCYGGALNLSELTARTDVGSIDLNALYSAPSRDDASFAFGMRINDFHIGQFLDLLPEMDTLMPMLQGIDGIITADLAATTRIDSMMNFDIPSLKAAVMISGDSLRVLDDETFKTVGKWLMFKDKQRNIIDSMTVRMVVDNSQLRMFPFIFNMDRYRLGVMGSNDMALNFNYHVAVLKSPIPFRFGINVSGTPDKMKIRVGRAKFNEKNVAQTMVIADTTRVNLVGEIREAFRRGVNRVRMRGLDFGRTAGAIIDTDPLTDTISHADSLYFIGQGVLPAPPADSVPPAGKKPKGKRK